MEFGSLTQLTCLMFPIKLEKCFDDMQNVKKINFEGDWTELRPKMFFLRESRTKYLEKNREIQ